MTLTQPSGAEDPPHRQVRSSRAPGPSSRAKIARIVEAARRLFAENGYSETSMEAIAREAKVGKATVYAHFTSKEDLFAAIVTLEGEQQFTLLSQYHPEAVSADLHEFGRFVFALVTAPENTDIIRMISAEAKRFPELGRIFYEAGPRRLVGLLARYLEWADQSGELSVPDPMLAAHQFMSLIAAEFRLAALLGVHRPMSEEESNRAVAVGAELFLNAYRNNLAPDDAQRSKSEAEAGSEIGSGPGSSAGAERVNAPTEI